MVPPGAPLKEKDEIVVTIEDINSSGEGVGRFHGFAVFVPGALVGEKVKARVDAVKRTYAHARLLEVLVPGPLRTEPACFLVGYCGGCQLQHLDYPEQLKVKAKYVGDALKRLGGLEEIEVKPVIGMQEPYHYRNKAQFPIAFREGKAVVGFYAMGSHHIVDCEECLLQHPRNNQVLQVVAELLNGFPIPVSGRGAPKETLRFIVSRVGYYTGEVMVVLVTRDEKLPHKSALVESIVSRVSGVVSVVQNINPTRGGPVLGKKNKVLYGKGKITDNLLGLAFQISPNAFYQVNPRQTEKLYRLVEEWSAVGKGDTVADLYCGIGTMSLIMARRGARVIGVEVNPDAVDDARANACLNGIENAEFVSGDVGKVLAGWYQKGLHPEVIILDPPRKGCAKDVLEGIGRLKPRRIIYVSCNPSTLARDLQYLKGTGYTPQVVQPVDMFPHTTHVECVVLMSRVDK